MGYEKKKFSVQIEHVRHLLTRFVHLFCIYTITLLPKKVFSIIILTMCTVELETNHVDGNAKVCIHVDL